MRPYYSQGSRVPVLSFTSITKRFCHLTLHSSRWPHRMPGLAKHAFPTTGWLQSTSWRVRRCPFTEQSGNPETVHSCDSHRLRIPWLFQLALFRVLLDLNSKGSGKEGSMTAASRCICLLPHPTLADCLVFLPSRCAWTHMGTLPRPLSYLGTGAPVLFAVSTLPLQTPAQPVFILLLLLFCFVS